MVRLIRRDPPPAPLLRFGTVFFYLPPFLVAGMVLLLCHQFFLHGLNFVPELTLFSMFLLLASVGLVLLLSVAIAIMVMALTWKHLKDSQKVLALGAQVIAVVLGLMAFPLIDRSLAAGRQEAYESLDTKSLVAESRTLVHHLKPSPEEPARLTFGSDGLFHRTDGSAIRTKVPYLAGLKPKTVLVHPQRVIIQLGGGGPSPCEGVIVIDPPQSSRFMFRTMDGDEVETLDGPNLLKYRASDSRNMLPISP